MSVATAHDVKCPHCGAGLREWCIGADGRPQPILLHTARRRAFAEARNRARDELRAVTKRTV